jgi:hypothetical protein
MASTSNFPLAQGVGATISLESKGGAAAETVGADPAKIEESAVWGIF